MSIFDRPGPFKANACLNFLCYPIDAYAEGYKRGADQLVEYLLREGRDQDMLVYPIVFLYRQYLELRLKQIIQEGGRLIGKNGVFPQTHDLEQIWILAKRTIETVYKEDPEPADLMGIEQVIKDFAEVDRSSYSYRYPTDKSGNNSIGDRRHINLFSLSEGLKEASGLLDGAVAGIAEYRNNTE